MVMRTSTGFGAFGREACTTRCAERPVWWRQRLAERSCHTGPPNLSVSPLHPLPVAPPTPDPHPLPPRRQIAAPSCCGNAAFQGGTPPQATGVGGRAVAGGAGAQGETLVAVGGRVGG